MDLNLFMAQAEIKLGGKWPRRSRPRPKLKARPLACYWLLTRSNVRSFGDFDTLAGSHGGCT